MGQLTKSTGPETGLEKVLKFAIPIGVGLLIFSFWGSIVGFFAATLKSTAEMIFWGAICVPLIYMVWYFINNYSFIIKRITGSLVEYNPVFFIRKAIYDLKERRENVGTQINVISGGKRGVDGKITKLQMNIQKNGGLGAHAYTKGNTQEAAMYGGMVETDKNSLSRLQELEKLSTDSLQKLQKVYDYWGYTIQGLEHEADNKEEEWEIVKPLVKGLKSAEAFINSNNKIVQEFGQGMVALQGKIDQAQGFADEFDRRSKGILANIDNEQEVLQLEGLKSLTEFMDDKSLLLPTPKVDIKANFNNNIQSIAQTGSATPQFKFLNK